MISTMGGPEGKVGAAVMESWDRTVQRISLARLCFGTRAVWFSLG
jgi:hypothetical protein